MGALSSIVPGLAAAVAEVLANMTEAEIKARLEGMTWRFLASSEALQDARAGVPQERG